MDFNLTKEQLLVRKMMADFTENEVKPIAAETDRTAQFPAENIEKLFHYGVMGMGVPKEYGGSRPENGQARIYGVALSQGIRRRRSR